MGCVICGKPAAKVTKVTDPILRAQVKRLARNFLIVETEHPVCEEHYDVLTGRTSPFGGPHVKK